MSSKGKEEGFSLAEALEMLLVRLHNSSGLPVTCHWKILGMTFASSSWSKCLCSGFSLG